MKTLLCIGLLFLQVHLYAQKSAIIQLVFKDVSNFTITKSFAGKVPAKYYLLTSTDKWNRYHFKVDEDLTSDSVRKAIENEEHHPYHESYLFKDTTLEKLFPDSVKEYLYQQTQTLTSRQLSASKQFTLIKSFKLVQDEFFFSVTDPIFTPDNVFAFIDLTVYHRDGEAKQFRDTYFATTLLIYQNVKEQGWIRIKKIDHLLL